MNTAKCPSFFPRGFSAAAILEKKEGHPLLFPSAEQGGNRHTPRAHALIVSIHAFEANRACGEHPAKSGIACQLRTISTMFPATEAASPARDTVPNMALDGSADGSAALAVSSSGVDASRTSMWSVGATNCAWPETGRPPSRSNSSPSMAAIT